MDICSLRETLVNSAAADDAPPGEMSSSLAPLTAAAASKAGLRFPLITGGIHLPCLSRTPVPLLGPASGADLEWRYAHNVPRSFADQERRALPVLLVTVRRLSSHFGHRKFRLRITARVVHTDQDDPTPVAVYCAYSPAFVSVSRIQTPASIATQRRRRATQQLGVPAF